ncbi:3-methyl-2-oxobutanoate hydroxymethyltransferase [Candidatus Poribacteria bacterium]|nr:3-methyl-2-oxobutanoate hydroxymethyltransferase [Candidatus Poribacteria bacterium]MYB64039.1 3-methyl-2-oxobutanoate hydroxymethyltransferase [Candidatus Poribacteria bacterium]MYF56059.1 3-methyl-2-oxobutanoate hydroxymethyltransferase [Candidatus Poribacteria bacterium]MYI92809.1 3-methyl-2-oxobutanoate hydroxymethyltransferase [Candidatus Poribacteria bacterium]
MKKDIAYLQTKKQQHQPITVLTCYDYPTACMQDAAEIDIVFVGDSVGTNILGYKSEMEVTMADMLHHLKAVRRGVTYAYLLVDMPYASDRNTKQAVANANVFLDNGADGIKLEGGTEKIPIVTALTEQGIDVCTHIGHNPQIHGTRASTHGKTVAKAKELIQTASALENAGAKLIVLEKITEEISQIITDTLDIPTIGIGSGRYCDGQVLVINDILGIGTPFRHAKRYQDYSQLTLEAICQYKQEVENGDFPTDANVVHIAADKLARIQKWLEAER